MKVFNVFASKKPKIDYSRNGTHGSHWDCISPQNEGLFKLIGIPLPPKYLVKLTKAEFANLGEKVIAVSKYDLHGRISMFITRVEIKDKNYEIATAYPVLNTENVLDCNINTVYEWPIKIEAQIDATLGKNNANIHFFATDYFLKKKQYLENKN